MRNLDVLQIVEEFTFDEFFWDIFDKHYNTSKPENKEIAQYLFGNLCEYVDCGGIVSKEMIFQYFKEWEFFTKKDFAKWCWKNRIPSYDVEYFKCEEVNDLYFVHTGLYL